MWEGIKNYFANFDGTTNACRTVALWITVALVFAFLATKMYTATRTRKLQAADAHLQGDISRILNGAWIAVALGFAVCLIVTFSTCYFVDVARGKDTLVPILFYPLLALVISVAGGAIAFFIKPVKIVKIIVAAITAMAFIDVLVCMVVYYALGEAGEALSNIGLYISAAFLSVGIVCVAFVTDRKSAAFDTKTVTYAAICIALSFALSYVRLFKMPMGGSITFASMLPLMLFAFIFGSRKGLFAGLIYGILQAVQDPLIIHPAQFILDYAAAFAAIGLTGCVRELGAFKNNIRAQFATGASLACFLRLACHYFAGVFAFGMYGADFAVEYGMPTLANEYFYSFVYQIMYLLPELAIVLAVGMTVMTSKNFRAQISALIARNSKPAEKQEIRFDAENKNATGDEGSAKNNL